MMAAFNADRDHVVLADVQSAISELRWTEFSARVAPRRKAPGDSTLVRQLQEGPSLRVGQAEDTGQFPSGKTLARLVVVADGRNIGELPLREGRTVIGRTVDNDLQIDSRFVSRHHCQIVTTASACVVEDLNSTNGIVVKSRRVRSHNLNDGDVITIGRHDLIYIDERGGGRTGQTDRHRVLPAEAAPPPEGEPHRDPPSHGETQVL
jgi:hypothetical protein